MQIDLRGKVCIITGGARGIGLAIAQQLAEEEIKVVIADIRQEQLDEVAQIWGDNGWEGAQIACDIRSPAACKDLAQQVQDRFGQIDILVNNAGVATGNKVENLTEEAWDANMDVNLKGTFLMAQAVIPFMKAQNSGRIINASSFAAIIPGIGGAAYSASKSGVQSLTRVLAGELGAHNITVNAYAPGMIPTQMNRFAEQSEEVQENLLDTLSLRRWGDPKDIANLICFLASDQAAYITGAMIDISGGKFATQMPWKAYRDKR